MYKIAHISDTHIRNLKFHKEYRQVFSQIYKTLKEQNVDYIVHCGDLAHTKTQLSPEYFDLAADFLKNLSDIAPTYIILGNHDGNLKNDNRQDAVTPIVQALNHPNLHLIKDSGEVHVTDDLCFNVLSIFDEENWQEISDKNKTNVALYHGAIYGVVTDTGYMLEHGDHDVSIFEGFDYAMLGDIHRTNQPLDSDGRVRYCGSTIQQNFGETNDKGYLLWNIESKDKFSVKHFPFFNPRPFVTVEINADGTLPDITVPKNAQLRLICNNHIPAKDLKKAVDVARSLWLPDSVTAQNKPGKALSIQDVSGEQTSENLRDLAVQEKLIKEYLDEYQLDDKTFEKIFELNRQFTTLAEQDEEVARNVKWSIKNLEWNNLFNYGEDNSIDFANTNGIVGIFGKNYSGKSSVIDALLWSMFNSISKNVRKNVDIINQNKDDASTRVEIQIDEKLYSISREAEKYTRKLYGEETTEAKTSVDFSVLDLTTDTTESLNGIDRKETDANIRRVFGLVEDFLLTSMTSQHGSMQFINEGSTKRKEILSKFLDLELFEKKHKLAKNESAALKKSIKNLESRDFGEEILQSEKEKILTEKELESKKEERKEIQKKIETLQEELSDLKVQAAVGPKTKLIDIREVEEQIASKKEILEKIDIKQREINEEIEKNEKVISQLSRTLEDYDYESLQNDKKKLEELNKDSIRIDAQIKAYRKDVEDKNNKLKILDTVPCGDQYPKCRFLVDANEQKEILPEIQEKLSLEEKAKQEAEETIEDLGESIFVLNEWEKLSENKRTLQEEIAEQKLKLQKILNLLPSTQTELQSLEDKKKEYYENEEWMKKLENIKEEKEKIDMKISSSNQELANYDEQISELSTKKGVLTQKVETLEEQQLELEKMREEYNAYDLFLKSMHSNGIVYSIIKKRLPILNAEMAKILSNIVNFDVFFEDDGKKLDIYIKHPKYEPRPLELGSGAEKSIASIAIRLALIKTSSLPVGDLFIMDEPATALDEDNMEGFTRILDMVKNNFKTVILISHLDALKDVVDKQIAIEKIDGFANVHF